MSLTFAGVCVLYECTRVWNDDENEGAEPAVDLENGCKEEG